MKKRILLLGDSIRMGYDDFVKEMMPDYEIIYDSEDNSRFSSYTLWQFNQLYKKYGSFDMVHFNSGYWDLNPECPNGESTVPIEDYIRNLKRLIEQIKYIGAIPVFATITPVDNDEYLKGNIPYNNDLVDKYNNAALKLMKEENVIVNDLYSLLDDKKDKYKCSDKLHLTTMGYMKCAKQIKQIIESIFKE